MTAQRTTVSIGYVDLLVADPNSVSIGDNWAGGWGGG